MNRAWPSSRSGGDSKIWPSAAWTGPGFVGVAPQRESEKTMTVRARRRFTPDQKAEAVCLVRSSGHKVAQVACEQGLTAARCAAGPVNSRLGYTGVLDRLSRLPCWRARGQEAHRERRGLRLLARTAARSTGSRRPAVREARTARPALLRGCQRTPAGRGSCRRGRAPYSGAAPQP